MRIAGHSFTLERNAMTLVTEPASLPDFSSTQQIIEQGYYPECAELVKKLAGADHVSCFGFRVRGGGDDSPAGKRKPVMNAHVDYTVDTVRTVAERIAPDHLKGRGYRLEAINVWRPIAPVERNPLAMSRLDGDTGRPLLGAGSIHPAPKPHIHTGRISPIAPRSNGTTRPICSPMKPSCSR